MKAKATGLLLPVGIIILAGFTQITQAIPTSVSGTVSFSGTASTDTGNLATATKFTMFQDVFVGAESALFGDYSGTSGASVNMSDFAWDPPGPIMPIAPLWIFASGGVTYSFQLNTLHKDFASPTGLLLSGLGTAIILGPGVDKLPTTGLFEFSAQTHDVATFTFSTTTQVPPPRNAPDGGQNILLLGSVLAGLCLMKRKDALSN